MLVVTLTKDARGRACGLTLTERTEKLDWARLAHGAYLLRTNHPVGDPAQLWRWYIQLTQAEGGRAILPPTRLSSRTRRIFNR